MQHITFNDLSVRYGRRPAFSLLLTIERLAQIRDEITSIDLNTRFEKALHALSNINFAS